MKKVKYVNTIILTLVLSSSALAKKEHFGIGLQSEKKKENHLPLHTEACTQNFSGIISESCGLKKET